MKIKQKIAVIVIVGSQLSVGRGFAQTPGQLDPAELLRRIEELEQTVKVQKRNDELAKEAAAERSKSSASVSLGAGGLQVVSADSNFVMRVRGGLQADGRFFTGDSVANDTFLLRRVRPILEGTTFGIFDYRLMADFASGVTQTTANNGSILDAYLNARLLPAFQIQAGKFKEPVGLERLQSWRNLLFVERGYPTQLVPNRDVGVMLHGGFWNNSLSYQAGVFNGTADGGSADFDVNDSDKDVAARIFAQPFKQAEVGALRGLGLGVAGTFGERAGTPRNYFSEGAQRFFNYLTGPGAQPNVINDGATWRVTPQGYYYWGSFGILAEYVIASQELRQAGGGAGAGNVARFENTAWQVAASYFLTGEANSFESVTPRKAFNPNAGDWGAWEITARFGELDVDDAAFPIFADANQSATRAVSWGVGLNWHLNRNVKLQLNYANTDFAGGAANPALAQREHLILSRVQCAF